MGWFSNPNCPHCGSELEETGYAAPYPSWRCRTCIKRNRKEKEHQQEIQDLNNRIAKLERAAGDKQ